MRLEIWILALVITALAGCNSSDSTRAGGDGGMDAGQATSSSTASTTATSGSTAGSGGSPDTGGGDPGWKPVGFKTPCPVEVATHPEAAAPKLQWKACPDGQAGCESLVVDWDFGLGVPVGTPSVVPWGDGYRVGLYLKWGFSEARVAVFETDGTPLVVWRSDGCPLLFPRLGPERVWFGVQKAFLPSSYIVEPYDKLASATNALPLDTASQLQDANDSLLTLEGINGDVLTVYDRLTNEVTSFGAPALANQLAHPVGDVAFFLSFPAYEKPEGWIWKRSTHDIQPLVQPGSEYVVDIRSDGSTIVWIQVPPKDPFDLYWPQGDLWTSTFATSASTLQPLKRRPAPIVGYVPATIGQGYYALYSMKDEHLHVYRLSDMHHWEFAAPPQLYAVEDLGYIDPSVLWYQTQGSIVRQQLDALGPGDAAPN